MRFIGEYPGNRMIVAAGAFLIIGAISFSPPQLIAQEQPVPAKVSGQQNPESAARVEALRSSRPSANDLFSRSTLPPTPTEVAPARFVATVYEVQVPQNRIADLDAQALEASAVTPQSLTKALGEFGETKVLYKIDQPVNLYIESIALKSSEPLRFPNMEPSQPGNSAGSTRYHIVYMQTGFTVNISANALKPQDLREGIGVLQVNFQLTGIAGLEGLPDVNAARSIEMKLNQSGSLRFGKPTVLLNVSNPRGAENAQPVVYVVCYVFKEIKP